MRLNIERERQQEFGITPAAPVALDRYRGLAARQQQGGEIRRFSGDTEMSPCQGPCHAGMYKRHLARLAFDGVAEYGGRYAALSREFRRGFERHLRRGDELITRARQPRIAWLRRLVG